MSKPKPLICPQCGGSINRTTYICEYCGTQFKKEHDAFEPIQFEVLHPGTHVLALQTRIPEEMMHQMGAQETGESAPYQRNLAKLCKLFDWDVEYILKLREEAISK